MNSLVDSRTGGFRARVVDESTMTDPVLLQARVLWDAMRGDRPMPSRADFDPAAAPRGLLPHIILVDVVRTPQLRLRWRLLGTHITKAMGRDSSGQWFDELYNEKEMALAAASFLRVVETGQPVCTIARAPTENRAFLTVEAIDLPLSSDGETIDMILGACHFYSRRGDAEG